MGYYGYSSSSRRRAPVRHHHVLLGILIGFAVMTALTVSGYLTVNILQMNASQWTLSAIIFFGLAVIGLAWKLYLDANNSDGLITWTEYIVGVLLVGVLLSWLGVSLGWKWAYNSTITFNQNINVWEAKATANDVTCTRDGSCVHTYACDPYTVIVPYTYSCGVDDKETCTGFRDETDYHSCPYVTHETSYVVTSTAGDDFVMGASCMPANPDQNRWRITEPVNTGGACIGIPPQWQAAKDRVDSGHPGPITTRSTYQNYVLASDTTILKQYSSYIDQLKKAGYLPDLPHDIRDYYYEDRVVFVGPKPANAAEWEGVMSYFDSALGNELHGDGYLVVVTTNVGVDPETYLNALKADWTDTSVHGKDALPKNALVAVIWTDGKVVTDARATTGMPVGNNALITQIQNHMAGTPFTPGDVVGLVSSEFYTKTKSDGTQKTDVKGVGTDGFLRQATWGLNDPSTKFCRVSMSGNSDCGSGFSYLKNDIRPSFGQQLTIVLALMFFGLFIWPIEAYFVGELRN